MLTFRPRFVHSRLRRVRSTMRITVLEGDITAQQVDAVVNAANRSLLGGGGVDGAIHRRGGPAIVQEGRRLRETDYPDGLPTGQAVATTAGRLPAQWVIHTVGPVWSGQEDRSALLRSCYREALRLAADLGAATVAFPAISCGIYGWPLDDGARQALAAVQEVAEAGQGVPDEIRFVLFGAAGFGARRPHRRPADRHLAEPPPGPSTHHRPAVVRQPLDRGGPALPRAERAVPRRG